MTRTQIDKIKLPSSEIIRLDNGLAMTSDTELEKWRAETLFSKEPETIAWIDHYSKNGGFFYDVGANIGGYSLYAAYTNRDLSVYSFEPVTNNYLTLLRNKELNKLSNLIPFQLALSSASKLDTIYISDDRIGNSGAQVSAPINEHGQRFKPLAKEILLCLRLDSMVDEYNFPIPSFMKIDVDGHELDILGGAMKTLTSPELASILIECNGDESMKKISLILSDKGFIPDDAFNKIPNHSSNRRRNNTENVATNVVYSRGRKYL